MNRGRDLGDVVLSWSIEEILDDGLYKDEMGGYVLPTFEPTSIFEDKDIIRVRRKNLCMKEVTETVNLEEQPVVMSQKFLAIKNSTEDSHGYNNKAEGGAYAIIDNTVPVDSLLDENVNSHRKRKHSDVLQDSKNDQDVATCQTKLPSRSAYRKKAKRQWLRGLRKSQLEEHKESQIPENDIRRKSPEGERINQNNGTVIEDDSEVVPVVIRPGHIRFEPVGKISDANPIL